MSKGWLKPKVIKVLDEDDGRDIIGTLIEHSKQRTTIRLLKPVTMTVLTIYPDRTCDRADETALVGSDYIMEGRYYLCPCVDGSFLAVSSARIWDPRFKLPSFARVPQ